MTEPASERYVEDIMNNLQFLTWQKLQIVFLSVLSWQVLTLRNASPSVFLLTVIYNAEVWVWVLKRSDFFIIIICIAGMAELVDAQDLKSCAEQSACRFDPGSRQQSLSGNREAFFYFYPHQKGR